MADQRSRESFRLVAAEIGIDEATEYWDLTILAQHSGWPIQPQAIGWLGDLRYHRAIGLLVRLIWDADKREDCSRINILGQATEALGRFDNARCHAALVDIFNRAEDIWTRSFAIDAMGYEVCQVEPEILIRAIRNDEEPQIQRFALMAVFELAWARRFRPYEEAVIQALSSPDPCVRAWAIEAIGATCDYRYGPLLERHLHDEEVSPSTKLTVAQHAREAMPKVSKCKWDG